MVGAPPTPSELSMQRADGAQLRQVFEPISYGIRVQSASWFRLLAVRMLAAYCGNQAAVPALRQDSRKRETMADRPHCSFKQALENPASPELLGSRFTPRGRRDRKALRIAGALAPLPRNG